MRQFIEEEFMKRLSLIVMTALFTLSLGFGQEVSERKDVSIFGVYSSYNMPSAAVMYFDDQMVGIFNAMKRFQVIGYQYRLDETSAVKFIENIKKLKEQKALKDQKYMDEDLGVVVIPGAELDKMIKSTFIIIPSISGWRVAQVKVEKKVVDKYGNVSSKWVVEWQANVSVSIKVLNSDGDLMEVYNRTVDEKSEKGDQDAYQKAINNAVSGLGLFLRKTDEFKLKTKVLQNLGAKVYLQLGNDLGVKPGYEFVLKKQLTIGDGFTTSIDAGLVRVSKVGDNYSEAAIIKGAPQANDQLIESALGGGRFSIYGGISTFTSSVNSLVFDAGADFSVTKNFNPSAMTFDLGLASEFELGYAGLARAAIGILINSPSAFYLDIGGGYEIYMGSVSIVPELDLSLAATYISLGTGSVIYSSSSYDGSFSLLSYYLGAKPKISINIQASQKFKFRIYAGYAYYFGLGDSFSFSANDGTDIDISTYTYTTKVNGSPYTQPLSKLFDLNGIFAGAELVFRF